MGVKLVNNKVVRITYYCDYNYCAIKNRDVAIKTFCRHSFDQYMILNKTYDNKLILNIDYLYYDNKLRINKSEKYHEQKLDISK